MAKNLKLHIKNLQLAGAIDLHGLKQKLSKGKSSPAEEQPPVKKKAKPKAPKPAAPKKSPRSKAPHIEKEPPVGVEASEEQPPSIQFPTMETESFVEESAVEAPAQEEILPPQEEKVEQPQPEPEKVEPISLEEEPKIEETPSFVPPPSPPPTPPSLPQKPRPFLSARRENPYNLGPVVVEEAPKVVSAPSEETKRKEKKETHGVTQPYKKAPYPPQKPLWEPLKQSKEVRYKAFVPQSKQPTGPRDAPSDRPKKEFGPPGVARKPHEKGARPFDKQPKGPHKGKEIPKIAEVPPDEDDLHGSRRKAFAKPAGPKPTKEREGESEARPSKKQMETKRVVDDSRLRRGLVSETDEEGELWRKRRPLKQKFSLPQEIEIVRPKEITVRLPIVLKDLAQEMKLKAAQLISKLFLSGVVATLNDVLDDETTVQLLGEEFGCTIHIDTSEEKRIRITDQSIREEISSDLPVHLMSRPCVVAFMGHVDHGKTSIIDKIRKSNRVQSEIGAITQHIGAFVCVTSHGPLTILDTPGHEAFFEMRKRGADVTDIVVLVIAGDEGIKEQTEEALQQAKDSKATIVVAINKCDKMGFDENNVLRQLAEHDLLPEVWGGKVVTVKCSALTGEGIDSLLEMLALQAEVLELKANPKMRARGTVIEAEMHKGLGPLATLLVQNGTLRLNDAIVFESSFAKVKSMRDEYGRDIQEAGPSMAVRVHGLSSMPSAGEEFIVVPSEKEAKEIAEVRLEGKRQSGFMAKKRKSVENMMVEQVEAKKKKILNVIVRADVQGSLEALCNSLSKITSDKIDLDIISQAVGEISESDVQLASASGAVIIGYHVQVEAHAEQMIKDSRVTVRLHNIIYHAQDDVKEIMKNCLDKIPNEVYRGKAEVKALFKSSHYGNIAGCMVIDGTISRHNRVRIHRGDQVLFEGSISSLKRFKEDVKEVSKGAECGIVVNQWNECAPQDIIESFDIEYLSQDL